MIHIVIIWPKAIRHKDFIINEIKEKFDVIKVFKIHWEPDSYSRNISIFYSHSLKDFSDSTYKSIIRSKIKNVGKGAFYLIVFEDKTPNIEQRETTSGVVAVNTNTFDLKTKLRSIVGGSRVHSSNDDWETNKDLTILLGLNTEDFLSKYKDSTDEIEDVYSNCIGFNGYDNIRQFFYVLNNCVNYVVLRNHEFLPDSYVSMEHGDIDLLVEHYNYVAKLTNALKIFRESYRVYHTIRIAGSECPFDFRFIGDGYYDEKWERTILQNRELKKGIFYAPNSEDQFYSLLYHAYIQKYEVKEDYYKKLSDFASAQTIDYNPFNYNSSLGLLYPFLKLNGYAFSTPIDKSVVFNKKNHLICTSYQVLSESCSFGSLTPIHLSHPFASGYVYYSAIKDDKKVFIKYGGTGNSCEVEYMYTQKMFNIDQLHFVKPVQLVKGNEHSYAVYEYLDGKPLLQAIKDKDVFVSQTLENQLVTIYNDLIEVGVMHRDIRPENFIVVNGLIKLFDFQYAIDSTNRCEYNHLIENTTEIMSLGSDFRYNRFAWSDYYSFLNTANFLGVNFETERKDKPFYMSPKVFVTVNFWKWLAKKIKHNII